MSRCIHGSGCVSCDIRADAGVCVSGEVVGFGGIGEEEAKIKTREVHGSLRHVARSKMKAAQEANMVSRPLAARRYE